MKNNKKPSLIYTTDGKYVRLSFFSDRVEISSTNLNELREEYLINPTEESLDCNTQYTADQIKQHDLSSVMEDILINDDSVAYVSDAQDGCIGYKGELVPVFGITPLSNTPLIALYPGYDEYHDRFTSAEMVFHFPFYQTTSELLALINDEVLIFPRVEE